jgi:diadenylate cyclase
LEKYKDKFASYGDDGRLISMQLEELIGGLEKEELLIIKDYFVAGRKKITEEKIMEKLLELSYEEFMKPQVIAKLLGYENFDSYEEVAVYPKGYRILNKIPRMPSNIVENLVKSFKSFQHILAADIDDLDKVEGNGEIRAQTIKQSLKRMQEQYVFDNVLF